MGAVGGAGHRVVVGIPQLPPRPRQRATVVSRTRATLVGGYMATRQTAVKCNASPDMPRGICLAARARRDIRTRAYASDPYGEAKLL